MLTYFKTLSLGRGAWLLLALTAFALEATALYFQHGMGLVPCVLCIYERVAVLAVMVAGLIGAVAPRFALVRWLALAVGIYGSARGLAIAIQHTNYQLNPAPWNQCAFKPEFPQTLPLDQWLPSVFASGVGKSCNEIQWEMFGFIMPQWLILAFGVYLAVLVIVLLSQFKRIRLQHRLVFK